MGINAPAATFLARAKQAGVDFTEVTTIGRMGLAVPQDQLATMARILNLDPGVCSALAHERYSEQFFQRFLGAKTVRSIDHSSYQDANILHDMNQPVSKDLHESCDVLYDGGCMEHIFDVKQVLENYMNMVRVGGRIFVNVPANNLFGHGFYQFSSEFFYRVFDAPNGYVVREMVVIESPFISVEASRSWRCFRTVDPASVGSRIRLVSDKPLMLFVEAERTASVPPFMRSPMQSDYQARWDEHDASRSARSDAADGAGERLSKPFAYLTPWQDLKRRLKQRRKHSLRNRRFFNRALPL